MSKKYKNYESTSKIEIAADPGSIAQLFSPTLGLLLAFRAANVGLEGPVKWVHYLAQQCFILQVLFSFLTI